MPLRVLIAVGIIINVAIIFAAPAQVSAASAPTVTTQAATSIASTSAVLNGTIVSEGTASTTDFGFEYGTTTAYGSRYAFGTTYVGAFFTTLNSLNVSTTYHYRAYAVSSVGTSTGSDQFFTTGGLTISSLATSSTATSVIVTFNTNTAADSVFQFGTTTSYGTTLLTPATTTHRYTVDALVPASTYHFRISASDALGHLATTSDYTIMTIADTVPPVLSGAAISPTSAYLSVTWLTDEVSNSRIEVGTSTAYGMTSSSAAFETGHQLYLLGLLPSTLYHVRYISTDPYGNTSTSTDQTVMTTAPSIAPVSVSATSTNTTATITWTTYENAQTQVAYGTTAAYGIYTPITDGPFGLLSHTVALSGLTACTRYHYAAVSTAGVSTATSSDGVFSTTGCRSRSSSSGSSSRRSDSSAAQTAAPVPVTTSPLTSTGTIATPGVLFTRDITAGITGDDVRQLQVWLNAHGFVVATSGPGSVGNETMFFGSLTRAALARYQQSRGIVPAVGYFGPITRAQLAKEIR